MLETLLETLLETFLAIVASPAVVSSNVLSSVLSNVSSSSVPGRATGAAESPEASRGSSSQVYCAYYALAHPLPLPFSGTTRKIRVRRGDSSIEAPEIGFGGLVAMDCRLGTVYERKKVGDIIT